MDGLWVSQGDPRKVNEQQTAAPTDSVDAGAVRQFVAGQLGKDIDLPNPTNSAALLPVTYKYVRRAVLSAPINAPLVVLEYTDVDNFVVDIATGAGPIAGIGFMDDNNASILDRGVQPGKFGYIQTGGKALVQCGAGVAAGDILASQDDGTVDTIAAATEQIVGVALEAVGTTLANHVLTLLQFPKLVR
jgi:hypothetical protein